MKNLRSLILFIAAAVAVGIVYGLVHHLISYAISPEYFRLHLFGLFENLGPPDSDATSLFRLAVGSAWWVGLIVGGILAAIFWQFGSRSRFFAETTKAYLLTLGIAFGIGLLGLLLGWITAGDLAEIYRQGLVPPSTPLDDPRSFVAADYMHGTSYIGALVGLVVGIVFLLRRGRD